MINPGYIGYVTGAMFGALILLLILGLPLAFCLSGIAIVASILLLGFDSSIVILYNFVGQAWNEIFIAIPMFVLMGALLEKSGIADDLFNAMYRWFGSLRGGLAIGTIIICAIFAAMTGVTGAATVTMGLIALPAMLKRNYDRNIALGTIGAAGTLGILIPPSVSMVLIGAIAQISIGKLFMGGFGPGILLSILLILYVVVRSWIQPDLCPGSDEKYSFKEKIVLIKSILAPGLLIFVVTGSIILGIATPTEASALGAAATLILVLCNRRVFSWALFKAVTLQTTLISGMVMWIVFGAVSFGSLYTGVGGMELTKNLITGATENRWIALGIIYAILFFLGLFLDPTGIIFIVAPVAYPIIKTFNFDPIWFGVVFVMLLQVGYITPPFGFNLFYLKATAPEGITLSHIYNSVWPFVAIFMIGVVICTIFPEIVLWLPNITM